MRVYFKTFGCRVNQYETEALREKVLADGLSRAVRDFETADVCVVNTCTVTREADKDALTLIRRISRRNPAAKLLVAGCYATRAPEEIRGAAPAAVIVSNDNRDDIPALLGCRPVPDFAGIRSFSDRSRAFIKIQDGCNMHCTYCIIPAVRPKVSCKPYADLEREFRGLLENGYQELVLCGIRLGRYLSEDGSGRRVDFVGLIERLMALPGDFRIRLSSLEITDVTERFLGLFDSGSPKLCPSFHLPLQAGCEKTLQAMGRWYSAAFYARRAAALRERLPGAGLFSDIMVGFPGETDGDFEESLAFVRDIGFSGLHVFRYSRRTGTPAARRAQIPEARIRERAAAMHELDGRLRRDFAAAGVGSRRRVLLEKRGEGVTDHFLRVALEPGLDRGLAWVRLTASEGLSARGVLEPTALAGGAGH